MRPLSAASALNASRINMNVINLILIAIQLVIIVWVYLNAQRITDLEQIVWNDKGENKKWWKSM